MTNMTYNFLHLSNFKDIPNWSVQYSDEEDLGFTKKYPMARIGTFLVKSKDVIIVQKDVEYKQVTIKINNGGVVPRNNGETLLGSKIGTKRQHVVHAGQFIMSKIDARNGAYGIVPEELEGAIVTNDFPVFDVDTEKIIPQFLVLVSTTEKFVEFARKCSSGTTNRKRIDIDAFLNQQIPLPCIEEQEKILEMYIAKVKEADLLSRKSEDIQNSKNAYLKSVLKFYYNKNERKGALNFLHFTDISRWDVPYYSSQSKVESFYDTTTLGNCLDFYMVDYDYQSLRTETYKTPEKQFHYIGMENVEKNTGVLNSFQIVKGKAIKSQTIRIPKGFIIYGKLRPYLNKYWENNEEFDDIVCSSEFLCFLPKKEFNATYIKFVLSSYIIQDQIADSMTGARMPRIDDIIFKNIIIPIPPRSIQDSISTYLTEKEKEAFKLKDKSKSLQESAYNLFTTEIFTNL
jgi:restriction endonuclease S subunit